MFLKIYQNYLIKLFLKSIFIVLSVFLTLSFFLNILGEIKFFQNYEVSIFFTIFLTLLNIPSIAFELFPFIFLIATQLFFMKLHDNGELIVLKNYGLSNLKIIKLLLYISLSCGIFIITIFYNFSSELKHSYLSFKNNYTEDNKYLAVVNENGLWIKDIFDENTMIIHAEKIEKNVLKDIVITIYDSEFRDQSNIVAKEALINNNTWEVKNLIKIDNSGIKKSFETYELETNFDYVKINSLFSNLESLNIFELIQQKKDFQSVGLNIKDIDLHLHKLISFPLSLVIFTVLSSILMFSIKFNKSKTFMLILGIILSVIIYYIFYFFSLLGSNNQIPTIAAVWFPNLILFLCCMVGIVNINEK